MNFFGHAVAATWRSSAPRFVLGAMLPDFATMIRARPPESRDPLIREGIAYHHATDDAFHGSPIFRDLSRDAFDALRGAGVRRGPARAVAHVGIELLLDGALAEEAQHREAYTRALDGALGLGGELSWTDGAAMARFDELRRRLVRYGVRTAPSAANVAERLQHALAGRPLLALSAEDLVAVTRWVEESRGTVDERAPLLVTELQRALGR